MLEKQIDADIKTALLAGEQHRATVLRTVKAALLNFKVAQGTRDSAMNDSDVIAILSKEAKKRQESADMYIQGGSKERAMIEMAEKALIEQYLPEQMTPDEMAVLVDEVINATGANSAQDLGMVIGQTKAKAGPAADGGLIAKLAKERLGA
ncbi:GatB/YqeY domain-containing protein [Aeromicrobium sp.]|nr:GatB/YqeY domain-containing protein [Candidatus Saccharibacteria bacterium]